MNQCLDDLMAAGWSRPAAVRVLRNTPGTPRPLPPTYLAKMPPARVHRATVREALYLTALGIILGCAAAELILMVVL